MNELLEKLVGLVDGIREDAAKFEEKGNKAAGTRVRKAMQEIKAVAQEVRTYVSEKNNA
jgi:hypothetical protein